MAIVFVLWPHWSVCIWAEKCPPKRCPWGAGASGPGPWTRKQPLCCLVHLLQAWLPHATSSCVQDVLCCLDTSFPAGLSTGMLREMLFTPQQTKPQLGFPLGPLFLPLQPQHRDGAVESQF